MEDKLTAFLENYVNKLEPLHTEYSETFFQASITGKSELYKKAAQLDLEITRIHSNKEEFKKLKEINPDEINDQFLKRQYKLVLNAFTRNQSDEKLLEEIVMLSNKIEERFSTFRAELNGEKVTDNKIDEILKTSKDSKELQSAWEASKQIGEEVEKDVLKLVKLRNKSAQQLGFENYHTMSLELEEFDTAWLQKTFDELDSQVSSDFNELKDEIDQKLAEKYGVPANELMPWHYQDKFFQQGPAIYNVELDKYFKGKNVEEITSRYFKGMDLDIDDLLAKSDLYEKEGKYQHAYCITIDREGDVRVLCNVKDDHRWMGTMLHEFGHAAYDKYISRKIPWILREPAHIFATEAIAMLFGRFATDTKWLKDVIGISESESENISEDCKNSLRLEQLVFSRWAQVIFRFEKEMYKNSDQDLNKLWRNLTSKYQLMNQPEGRDKPDWASKIHIALYPAYYHNYMLGELLASQLYFYINEKVLNLKKGETSSFADRKEVGGYLKNLFFNYGTIYSWNELIEKSTGEKLNPEYYTKQFVKN